MLKLYDYGPSGNCYKARLAMAHSGIAYERVPVDLKKGEGRTPEFRAKFALGRVPVLELEDGRLLAESNAILLYLAEGSSLLPRDRVERAEALQWLFWEQYSHEPYVATVRAWVAFFGVPAGREAELPDKRAKGVAALETLERHLAKREWMVGARYGVADIALYAYTHVAPEGGFSLDALPAVRAWCARVAAQPGHVRITD